MAIQGKGGATEQTAHPPHGFHGAGNEVVSEGFQCTSDPLETGVDEEGPGIQMEQVGLQQCGLFNGDYSALGQLTFSPGDKFQLGLTYVHGFHTDDNTFFVKIIYFNT